MKKKEEKERMKDEIFLYIRKTKMNLDVYKIPSEVGKEWMTYYGENNNTLSLYAPFSQLQVALFQKVSVINGWLT